MHEVEDAMDALTMSNLVGGKISPPHATARSQSEEPIHMRVAAIDSAQTPG